jgi:hypothetical protein
MMKPLFMLPGEPFNLCSDHFHFEVSMEVSALTMALSALFEIEK